MNLGNQILWGYIWGAVTSIRSSWSKQRSFYSFWSTWSSRGSKSQLVDVYVYLHGFLQNKVLNSVSEIQIVPCRFISIIFQLSANSL